MDGRFVKGHRTKLLLLSLAAIFVMLLGIGMPTPRPAAAADAADYDMVMVASTGACVTVLGDSAAGAGIGTRACRGSDAQYWRIDASGYWRSRLDDAYCIAHSSGTSSTLAMALCSDPRAIATTLRSDVTSGYVKTGTTQAFDVASWADLTLYPQHTGSNQRFNWLQPSLDYLATHADHEVSYPLARTDTLSYEIELVRDQIARIQPPFEIPSSARRPTVFPGAVSADAEWVTRNVAFDLNFRDHGYLRMSFPPRNWLSTGLYAPPGQTITVTVGGVTAAQTAHLYVQLGASTDTLYPTSGNVASSGAFSRPPSVAFNVKLDPGENLIRTPYGGSVILRSNASINAIPQITVTAVQAPYFKLGETSEEEWLARRDAPVPMGELESDRFVIHVMSEQLRERTYAEMVALAEAYDTINNLADELAGLSPTAALPHTSPMGKQRIAQDVQISGGWGHSGFPMQVFTAWPLVDPTDIVTRSRAWGVWHELGHNYQMGAWAGPMGTEVTVNWWSLFIQQRMFGDSRVINYGFYPQLINHLNNAAISDKWTSGDAGAQLAMFDQLRILHPTLDWQLFTRIMRAYREKSDAAYGALQTEAQKRDEFARLMCEISGSNVVPHFTAWSMSFSTATRNACASKKALPARSWLIDGSLSRHTGRGAGTLLVEQWNDIAGPAVSDLTGSSSYPFAPSSSVVQSGAFEMTANTLSGDGRRVRALLHPPVTGGYRFWLSGSARTELRLSSTASAAGAVTVLSLDQATGQRGFDDIGVPIQRSQVITLTAGQKYYIELLQTDAGSSDHAAVAWEIPAGGGVVAETRRVIEGKFLSAYSGDTALTISRQPASNAAIRPGATVAFNLNVKNNATFPLSGTALVVTPPAGFTIAAADAANWQTGWRYVRIEALSEAGGGDHSSAREIEVLNSSGVSIDRSNWRIHSVSSEEATCDGDAVHAIDGDPNTIWHTRWCTAGPGNFPHTIVLDMNTLSSVGGVRYTPRGAGANGNIGQYRISVSVDAATWTRVAQGEFDDSGSVKNVTFTSPAAPYLRTVSAVTNPSKTATVTVRFTAAANVAARSHAFTVQMTAAYDAAGLISQTNTRNDRATINVTVTRQRR
jgi:hypothetical protein